MRKTLTPNMTRYDAKLKLKFDKATVKALLISALIGSVIGLLISFLSTIFGMVTGVLVFVFVAFIQLSITSGHTLWDYFCETVKVLFVPSSRYRKYEMTDDCRLTINTKERSNNIEQETKG